MRSFRLRKRKSKPKDRRLHTNKTGGVFVKSEQAIFLSKMFNDEEHCKIHWRVIKKYADDWEEDNVN